jgi:hypothetical protein
MSIKSSKKDTDQYKDEQYLNVQQEDEAYLVTTGYQVLRYGTTLPMEWLGLGDPYTVSLTVFSRTKIKQRRAWTFEEHKMFLAAVDLLNSKRRHKHTKSNTRIRHQTNCW